MNVPQTFRLISDFGVAIVALVSVAGFLGSLIWYILHQNKQREDNYVKFITNDLKHLSETTLLITKELHNFSLNNTEAHRYQREEHDKMNENQAKTCSSIDKTHICLGEVEKSLARINGYKA